ncbi:response regulator transcription factor [Pedobacter sp. HDW13]|uniref:LytR/AlgR family response regulator transcription factor n=1 Tax=Pedobacter sp. HDW13 TaxID=2714940 RepID=UPI001408106B|nr:LytTR family DNA-binding domain-containing protein [Pedobacter sp. HDW13]QIL40271.1 response regulator transcription factor [Pedobacter sp. HDW13]
MKLSCIIVDDDPCSIEQIVEYISLMPDLIIINSYNCATVALQAINTLDSPLDFLFTDVEMPDLSGIELAKSIRHKIRNLILVSGHLQYAITGYDIKAQCFLEKPFTFKTFESLVNKICTGENSYLNVKEGKKIEKVNLGDVIAFEGASNYVKIHTIKKIYISYYKLSEIESELKNNNNFIRINRSFIIAKNYIERIEGKTIFLKNLIQLNPGSTFKDQFVYLIDFIETDRKNNPLPI